MPPKLGHFAKVLSLAIAGAAMIACHDSSDTSSGSTSSTNAAAGATTAAPPAAASGTTTGTVAPAPVTPPVAPVATPPTTTGTLSGDTSHANNSTFSLNEDVALTFQATGLVASAASSVAVNIKDEFGNALAAHSYSIMADANGDATLVFAAPSTRYGYYKVEATLPDGASPAALGTRPAGFITYAVVPDPAKRESYGDSGSRFGMQGGFSQAMGNVLEYLGVHYLMSGPGWAKLEPQHAGQFAEVRSEALTKGEKYPSPIANNSGAWATYAVPELTTGSVPAWAMEPGSGTKSWPAMGILNSAGMEGMASFTAARAAEVSADFPSQTAHYYQVTWEPEMPAGFGGTAAQLVQFFKSSYASLHKADSKAVVMGPTIFPGDKFQMTALLAAGLADSVDAISMHPYVKFPPETHDFVSDIRTQMDMVKEAKGHSVPFVGTEHGFASGVVGELNQALGNVRATVILLGEGFKFDFAFYIADFWIKSATETEGTFGYYWNLNPKIAYGTDKIGPKPAVPAFAAMTSFLDGSTSNGVVAKLSGTQAGYRFTRNGSTTLVLWDYQATSSTITLPNSSDAAKVCDWMANCESIQTSGGSMTLTLGAAPTYVISGGA